MNLLELTDHGLFCPPAGIFIDPVHQQEYL